MSSGLGKVDATQSGAHGVHRDVVPVPAPKPPWRWQHYLAVIAGLFLVWGAWTLVAWLAAGPSPVTVYRDPAASAYTIATAYEVVAVMLVLGVGAYVVRGCLRQHRLTFGAQLCIAGLLAYWLDPFYNFLVPMNLYSSNFGIRPTSSMGNVPLGRCAAAAMVHAREPRASPRRSDICFLNNVR
jgi:hypothetical protein